MIAAFPGREFDWPKSFKLHWTVTTGQGNPRLHPYGQMPSNRDIKRWAAKLNIIAVQHNGLWKTADPYGPYIVGNPKELKRLINTAHGYGMKVALHCSLFYFYRKHKEIEPFFEQVKAVHEEYGTDGVYVDGLMFDSGERGIYEIDDKIGNWEMMRRLRALFGKDGVIIYHGTSFGTPVATAPNIDSYCDATLNGEGVKIQSTNDPYLRYQVRKYGISNTVGFWDRYPKQPSFMSDKDVIDIILEMNCREYWNGYAFNREFGPQVRYYWERLEELKRLHYLNKPGQEKTGE